MDTTPTPHDNCNGNGEWKSNAAAAVLLGLSVYWADAQYIPWKAASLGIVLALYLFLPRSMRRLGEWAVALYKTLKAKNGNSN